MTAAIEELQAHLDQQLQDVAETKKMINALRKRNGEESLYADVAVESVGAMRPDQYYGKPLATAAAEYLERRKQACPAEEIMRGLEQGGFDFEATGWKEKDRHRLLAVSLAKNNVKFHKLPNNTFGLLAWYDQAVLAKKNKDEKKQNGTEEVTEGAAEKASA
ncbi:MAG: hypothetical protein WBQ76_05375 [Candidatus Korobacteraceae bacterium]